MEPRIQFKSLNGFPLADEGKLETLIFLEAAKEIVGVIETFGKLFTPVTSDMHGNITKLSKIYETDQKKYHYLEDIVILNVGIDGLGSDALLWLKRGLQLICTFFENICNDSQCSEALKKHLQDAYDKTLKPYHGFIVQSTIKLIYSWVPTRSQLIGQGEAEKENLLVLSTYLPRMRGQLNRIDALLKSHNLDDAKKV